MVRTFESCDVEGLACSHKCNAVIFRILADCCEWSMRKAFECHVAVYLITDDEYIVLHTDITHPLQFGLAPYTAARVMGIT